jgi:hypothetical protein
MKTEELVSLLAAGESPVAAHPISRRYATALAWSLPLAVLIMATVYGVRSDLAQATAGVIFWVKLGFAGSLAGAGLVATSRLGRPGVRPGRVWAAMAAPLLLLWALAAVTLMQAEPAQRPDLILGKTWKTCAFNIALISLPLMAAMLWTMKGMAPTRLGLAGACAGLLAGALGTLIYTFHCPESAAPFVAIWYVIGIAIPTLIGATLGPRVLRW